MGLTFKKEEQHVLFESTMDTLQISGEEFL
jgi:hypothetical protein